MDKKLHLIRENSKEFSRFNSIASSENDLIHERSIIAEKSIHEEINDESFENNQDVCNFNPVNGKMFQLYTIIHS